MKNHSNKHKEIGARIALRRKELGLTQTDIAKALGKTQKTIASYEVGRNAFPIALLEPLSQLLKISVEHILGLEKFKSKPGPASKLQRQVEEIENLPSKKKKLASDFLSTLIAS